MAISALPTPPSTSDPSTFATKADALLSALPTFVTEANALQTDVNAKQVTASDAAIAAEAAQAAAEAVSGALKWVSGTTYGEGEVAWSPITFKSFRRKVTGAGTTDPSLDGTNWSAVASFGSAGADIASASTVDLTASTGNTVVITGTTTVTAFTMNAGQQMVLIAAGALPLTYHATTMNINGGANYTCAAGDRLYVTKDLAGVVRVNVTKQDGTAVVTSSSPYVRQTVLTGTVDTNGLPNFGGSTGSTTVTTSTTLTATAANGQANYTGSITNPSWTGLSTNGTMYLYLDIDSAGVCTPGSTTLSPTYRWGGADVTTNNQFTFNIQEMQGKVGNGSVATQNYRVFVGEVTVAGSVVTAITWYALMGRYTSASTATLPTTSTQTSSSHNIGVKPRYYRFVFTCTTADAGYLVGDDISLTNTQSGTLLYPITVRVTSKSMSYSTGQTQAYLLEPAGGGAGTVLTLSSWSYRFEAERGW